jgi:hypothetical protein
MRKKAIGISVVVAALVASVLVPAALSQVYFQPPTVPKPIKGKTVAKKKVKVANITCGTGPCSLGANSAKIKANGESFTGKVLGGSLGTGESGVAKVKLSKAARAAVAAGDGGKVKWSLTVNGAGGTSASNSGKRKLTP